MITNWSQSKEENPERVHWTENQTLERRIRPKLKLVKRNPMTKGYTETVGDSGGSRPSDKGGGWSSRHWDKGGGLVSKKFFSALRASFLSKNKGGGTGTPGSSPGSATWWCYVMFFFRGQSYRKVAVLLESVACSNKHDYCLKNKRAFEVQWKVIYLLWLLDAGP